VVKSSKSPAKWWGFIFVTRASSIVTLCSVPHQLYRSFKIS
jgi:hypothetical protein